MTTKQAADIIRMLLGCLKGEIEPPKQETIEEAKAFEQQGYECLEMAIKALEQEPCEDCISREAVNDGFKKYENGSFAYGCVWGYINELPSVTPKEKSEYEHDHDVVKAYNDGQAYILDKIRAEIENLYEYTSREDYIHQEETRAFIDKSEVLEIIDKYRGE